MALWGMRYEEFFYQSHKGTQCRPHYSKGHRPEPIPFYIYHYGKSRSSHYRKF